MSPFIYRVGDRVRLSCLCENEANLTLAFCTLLLVESLFKQNAFYFLSHSWVLSSLSRWSVCYPGRVLVVHNGRFISWPLFVWDLCSNCGSNPRHGGHWYIPWESTGYPKVIIAASWIFLFLLFSWWFPWVSLFKLRTMCEIISIFLFSVISRNSANSPGRLFFFWKVNGNWAQPNGKSHHWNKTDQICLFCYSRLLVAAACVHE